jgi:hypothetical protein
MPETTIAAPPPPPAAPPPAAPTPAPAQAPASPAPASAPSGKRGGLDDSFAELDGLAGKPADKPAPKDADDEPAEPAATPDPEHSDLEAAVKPKLDQQKAPPKVATLRAAYEKSKGELDTLRKELQAREAALTATKKEFDEFRAKP